MNKLDATDFTREEIRKRMLKHAAAIWQMRVKDVEAADPLVSYLLETCTFEFENTGKAIENTRQHIVDQLANVMCPEVIDLPRPAHAIFHSRPEEAVQDLPQTVQFFHRTSKRDANQKSRDIFFSPVVKSRIVNGDVRYLLGEQGLVQLSGRDRIQLERSLQPTQPTDYQSVWVGIELASDVASLAGVPVFFDWETESEGRKATYYRKLQDNHQTRWFLNDGELPVEAGFQASTTHEARLGPELDVMHQMEQEIMSLYHRCFVTLGNLPNRTDPAYTPRHYPPTFTFTDQQQQRYFPDELIWLEIRFSRDFPPAALATMEVRLNCFPIMNRLLNETMKRLQMTLNVYPLPSVNEFLFIRRVYNADSHDLYRSSPLRHFDELEDNSFMWRPHGVGRFDARNAREILEYVQQMLLEESRAFSALGSGTFTQTIENLSRNVDELTSRLQKNAAEGFTVGHPYIFVRPRQRETNIYIEFWSTDGKGGNHIPAGTRLAPYDGYYFVRNEKEDLFLLTTTVGGRDKPSITEKEYHLRQALLTRQRLVTLEDIRAECQAYFFGRIGDVPVEVSVEKRFAEGLIEGAGYVRCLDVLITPKGRPELAPTEWDGELERCRQHLADRSAMNLPYRVRLARKTS